MRQHMPRKYWASLPEAAAIADLAAEANERTAGMLAQAAHQSDGATSLQNQELLAPDEQALAPVITPETRAVAACFNQLGAIVADAR